MRGSLEKVLVYIGPLIIGLAIFIPYLWMNGESRDTFYERIDRDRELCLQRAYEDNVAVQFCGQAASQAEQAYRAATRFNIHYGLLLSCLFVAFYTGLVNLHSRIQRLERLKNA